MSGYRSHIGAQDAAADQGTLFAKQAGATAPLADRMRPRDLDDLVGQEALLGEGTLLRNAIESDQLQSILLWGPPGCGKTTLASVIARRTKARFVPFSAVLSGIKEIRELMKEAAANFRGYGQRTIVFIDEIHRFNKAQQDAFLPFVESGEIVLIGATTENPSFELNSALLSRSRVHVLEGLDTKAIRTLLERAVSDPRGLGGKVAVDDAALEFFAERAGGDARFALSALGFVAETAPAGNDDRPHVTLELARESLKRGAIYYDKSGEEHFNLVSALHKSLRNSDPDASLYWLARMLEGGEDPKYIARRMVRFASEDIGLADPIALQLANAARDAVHFLGMPEGKLALAQLAVYLATAPKSNAIYRAYKAVAADIEKGAVYPVPLALRNAPTRLMQDVGYGDGYRYAHDEPGGIAADFECLPEALAGKTYYRPSDHGFEKRIRDRIDEWQRLRDEAARGE